MNFADKHPNEKPPKRALGRGLGALLPSAGLSSSSGVTPKGSVSQLSLEMIQRDVHQPRKHMDDKQLRALADSIREQGVLQPILVRRTNGAFQIIAGERRWRAAQMAGLTEIPALVREVADAEAFELALVENLQRSDLNPIEEAEGYHRLIEEFGLSQEKAAQRVGKERSTVANALRLLGLPDEVKAMLVEGSLDMGHARALLGLSKAADVLALARKVVEQRLSVRETERQVKNKKTGSGPERTAATPSKNTSSTRAWIEDMQRALGTKVRLNDRGGKGTVEIEFYSYADLDRIAARLRK
ncbi:MAG: ParB/RepB/Spo0J family partition protein [Myxococcaceae bacterium]